MIHLKFLSIFIWLNFTRANECKVNGTSICIFSEVTTSTSNVYFNPFAEDNRAIEEVKFKKSSTPTLTDEVCKTFPNLKKFRAHKLDINHIAANALFACKKLTFMSFWGNKITHVELNIFEGCPELEYVSFQKNHLKEIDGRVFDHAPKLIGLVLGENFLTNLSLEQFPTLNSLVYFSIHANDITDLDEQELLRKFVSLSDIYIHNNLFNCNRLRIIINALLKKEVKLKRWKIGKVSGNTNLSSVENVECVSSAVAVELLPEIESSTNGKLSYIIIVISALFIVLTVSTMIYKAFQKKKNSVSAVELELHQTS